MTIDGAQGQTLAVNLEIIFFSHGQLYVAFSRVGKPDNLHVFAPENKTLNVVHRDNFHQIYILEYYRECGKIQNGNN